MKSNRSLIVLIITIIVFSCLSFVVLPPKTALAQAFFEPSRQFIISRNCNATTSIRRGTNPIPVNPNETYTALGENRRRGGTHAFILVNGERKWIDLTCGRYADAIVIDDEGIINDDQMVLLPFFDNLTNPETGPIGGPADMTPPPPLLNQFDQDITRICGQPGDKVSRLDFINVMNDHRDILSRIRQSTEGQVYGNRPIPLSDEDFLEDLTDAWFASGVGFEHIFCGEPVRGGNIGGFHFTGRYLQLQEAELAGRLPNNSRREEVEPGEIYTIGVIMKVDGGEAQSNIKGYGYTLSAEDILTLVTKAFHDNPTNQSNSQACLLKVEDDGNNFSAVFVRRSDGIRTFYPDATPDNALRDCVS